MCVGMCVYTPAHAIACMLKGDSGGVQGPAGAVGTALNWTGNLLIGLTFPTMLKYLGLSGSYAVFTLLNVGAFVFVRAYVVETKQRSLHQITEELLDD